MDETNITMAGLAIDGFENPLCWWWGYSRRDIWLAECRLEWVDPRDAWSAACIIYNGNSAEWLTRMRIPWDATHGYICVRDPAGPWLRLRMMHYGAPPTTFEPMICSGEFAKIGTIRPIRRDGAEYGRDVMHRAMIKISGACVLWDLPALISFESVHYSEGAITYVFTLRSFITLRVQIITSDCLHVAQEVIDAPY